MCEDFITSNTEYIPAAVLKKVTKKNSNETEFDYFMRCCQKLGINALMQKNLDYILPFDFLIGNIDRNYGNFGIIRNVETLEIIGCAPIFDNGNSLWYNEIAITQNVKSYPFEFYQDVQIKYIEHKKQFPIRRLSNERLEQILQHYLEKNSRCSGQRRKDIVEAVRQRKNKLEQLLV